MLPMALRTSYNGLPPLEPAVMQHILQSPQSYSMYNNNNYHCNLISNYNEETQQTEIQQINGTYGVNDNMNIFENTNNTNTTNACINVGNNYLYEALCNASYGLRVGVYTKQNVGHIFSLLRLSCVFLLFVCVICPRCFAIRKTKTKSWYI